MSGQKADYARPEVLVEVDWVEKHLNDPSIRIAEVDYDPQANYTIEHIPGAVLIDWRKDMNDPVTRDIVSKEQLEQVLANLGFKENMTLVLYGDFNNWFAAFAFWIMKYFGLNNVKLMNGGRKKWLVSGKPVTKEIPTYPRGSIRLSEPDETIRVYKEYVRSILKMKDKVLVDVRSPNEYTGEVLAPPEYPNEHAQRGGHIPGAVNIPWALAVNDQDGTFKSREELEQLYRSKGITPDKEVITYCRIGERSSHTWFVLTYLLGYPNVKNYDGSWTEWGNSIRFPIEK